MDNEEFRSDITKRLEINDAGEDDDDDDQSNNKS